METPLNIVEDNELLLNKGDGLIFKDGDKFGLIIVCPQCGKITSGRHVYDKETKSLTPSLVHDEKLGGCGWHGYLTNGIFKEA